MKIKLKSNENYTYLSTKTMLNLQPFHLMIKVEASMGPADCRKMEIGQPSLKSGENNNTPFSIQLKWDRKIPDYCESGTFLWNTCGSDIERDILYLFIWWKTKIRYICISFNLYNCIPSRNKFNRLCSQENIRRVYRGDKILICPNNQVAIKAATVSNMISNLPHGKQ